MKNTFVIKAINNTIESRAQRSAWGKGVTFYALEIVENLADALEYGSIEPEDILSRNNLFELACLNGASDWGSYSWGGSSLIYDSDIAERLCCPSELKRTNNGSRRPNRREEWLDTQARALWQAYRVVRKAAREVSETMEAVTKK